MWPEYVFLIFLYLLPNYANILVFFSIALFSDEPEVFLSSILPNSNTSCCSLPEGSK